MAQHDSGPSAGTDDCCAPKNAEPVGVGGSSTPSRAGLFSSGGAVLGAMLASACCWLPLLLIGMGASTVGVAGFFEAYRPYFLGVTAILLAAGFYYVHIRQPKCAPGEACEVPNPRLQRLNKISLWVATVLVLAFATFPSYVGVFFGDDGAGTAAAAQTPADVSRTYAIEGMTCEGCAGHIRTAVGALPGVKAVEVAYASGAATVVFEGETVDDQAVVQAVASAGYTARAPAEGRRPLATVTVGDGPDALWHDEARQVLYVANVEDTHVSLIDTSTTGTWSVLSTIAVARGPWGFADFGEDRVLVSSWEHALTVIDLNSRAVQRTIELEFNGGGLAVDAQRNIAYVVAPNESRVVEISLETGRSIRSLSTDRGPDGMALTRDGRHLVVAASEAGVIDIIAVDSGQVVRRYEVGNKPELVHRGYRSRIYVSNFFGDRIHVIDGTTLEHVRDITGVDGPEDPVESPDGRALFVASFETDQVYTFDTASGLPVGRTLATGDRPIGVAVTDTHTFVSNYGDDTVSVFARE